LCIVGFTLALCCGLLELQQVLQCSALHSNIGEQKESVFNHAFDIKSAFQN